MTNQPWTLTLRQYERAIMEEFLDDLHSDERISKAEYLRLYPNDCRINEWIAEMISAASHLEAIPPRILDDLFRRSERSGWAVLSIMNAKGRPLDYTPPQIRARQAAVKRAAS